MARRQREENTIIFCEEVKTWVGDEFVTKCDDPRILIFFGDCFLFLSSANLNAEEQRCLEQKVLLHFHGRSEESMIEKVEFRENVITFQMKSQ